MSFEEQIDCYRPQFREAYKEIRQDALGAYGLKDLRLKESADLAAWEPDESVLSYVPYINHIDIEMISETTDVEEVIKFLLEEKSAGLVVMGREISRHTKPSLIVITTTKTYFVIDPNASNRGLEVLKRALHERALTLWTTNGLSEADSLLRNYNLKLKDSNAQCCLGLHLQLMTTISVLPLDALRGTDEFLSRLAFPKEALIMARHDDLKLVSFHQLLRTWLSLENERIFDIDPSQIIHLDTRPLSLTAKNLILKRCCLVLKLADALEFYSLTEFSTMNRRVLDCLSDGSHPHTILMKNVMERDERNKKVSEIYLSHVDAPVLSVQPSEPIIPLSTRQSETLDA